MENEKKIKRTTEDYAGITEDLKNGRDNAWYLCIRWRYKAVLWQMILYEFLDGKNWRPEMFTKKDILVAIQQAGWREFTHYEYDGHRRDPDWYFVDEILEWCIRHNRLIEKSNDVYRRKLFNILKDKEKNSQSE